MSGEHKRISGCYSTDVANIIARMEATSRLYLTRSEIEAYRREYIAIKELRNDQAREFDRAIKYDAAIRNHERTPMIGDHLNRPPYTKHELEDLDSVVHRFIRQLRSEKNQLLEEDTHSARHEAAFARMLDALEEALAALFRMAGQMHLLHRLTVGSYLISGAGNVNTRVDKDSMFDFRFNRLSRGYVEVGVAKAMSIRTERARGSL